jgi:hypothetical protein
MNKLGLVLFLFFSLQGFAKDNSLVIYGTNKLPIEITLALYGLQNNPLPDNEFELLKQQAIRIEALALNLSKEEVFFIAKAAFYKTFLLPANLNTKTYFDGDSLKNLSLARKNTSNQFLKWFFSALERDAQNISQLPLYREYLAARNMVKIDKVDLRKIDKKVQLVSVWITKISPDAPELILKEITPLLQSILNKIEVSFSLMVNLSKESPLVGNKKETALTFFSIQEVQKKDAEVTAMPSVNDIIDSVDSTQIVEKAEPAKSLAPILPSPSTEDWLLNEDR